MPLRLPISRANMDILAEWLAEGTGVNTKYFQIKITNKFPGITNEEANDGVSGFHLYIETADISHETEWYGTLQNLHDGQTIWVTHLAPFQFDGSRYFQYAGVISGTPEFE